jgi:large subunit ribosomal protein L17
MRSMVTSLFDSERITTTGPKAKEARRVAERLITRAKKGYRAHQEGASLKSAGKDAEAQRLEATALAHWRQAGRFVRSTTVLRKLFDELAPLYLERNGGYTRILKLDHTRVGDNAKMVLLELVDTEVTKKPLMRGVKEDHEAEEKKPARKAKTKSKAATDADAVEDKPKKTRKTAARKDSDAKKAKPAAKKTASKAKAKSKSKSRSGK